MHGLAVLAAAAAIGAASWVWWRIERTERREALRALASKLGGRALPSVEAPERVAAELGGISLEASFARRRFAVRGEPLWGVCVRAKWPLAPGPAFVLQPNIPDPLELGGGAQRVALHESLARLWTASGSDAASALLTAHRSAMLAIGGALEIESSAEHVELVAARGGASDDVARFERVCRLATALASHGLERLRALAKRLDARVAFVGGAARIEVGARGAAVFVDALGGATAVAAGRGRWALEAELGAAVPDLAMRVGSDGALDPAPPAGLLGERARAALPGAGRFGLRISAGRAQLAWAEPPDDATIRAAIALLAALGGELPSGGAFR